MISTRDPFVSKRDKVLYIRVLRVKQGGQMTDLNSISLPPSLFLYYSHIIPILLNYICYENL